MSYYSLHNFNLGEMAECSGAIRQLGSKAEGMADLARSVVEFFYDKFATSDGNDRQFPLIRFFRTRSYFMLSAEQKECAVRFLDAEFCFPAMKCMVLEGTAGRRPEWNQVEQSVGHRVIPLPSVDLVQNMPMISRLITDLGLKIADLLEGPEEILIGRNESDYNVFWVEDAVHSQYIPAKEDFVIPEQIKSVIGFGGLLPSGNLVAMVGFSRVKISKETADMMRCIALAVNLAAMRFDDPLLPPKRIEPRAHNSAGSRQARTSFSLFH